MKREVFESRDHFITSHGLHVTHPACDHPTVATNDALPIMITLHDILMTPSLTYDAFLSQVDNKYLQGAFAWHHVALPGHCSCHSCDHSNDTSFWNNHTTLEDVGASLMDDVGEWVIQKVATRDMTTTTRRRRTDIGLPLVYAFGVGAGAHILLCMLILQDRRNRRLTDSSSPYPFILRGVCLVSPRASACGWREWTWLQIIRFKLSTTTTKALREVILTHHYSAAYVEYNREVMEPILDSAIHTVLLRGQQASNTNLLRYVTMWANRRDLSGGIALLDPIHSCPSECLIFC
eukprot:PhF_6_TR38087/c0_g2_i2/m.56804